MTSNTSINHPELSIEFKGEQQQVAVVTLRRPKKRNAINDSLVNALRDAFEHMPSHVRAAVIAGEGEHFCAGLDLSEIKERDAVEGMHHSRNWHISFDAIQYGRVPVVAALHGAVVGGGLELASTCHIRVADDTTFYALPEGSRGIFVGGAGSVRIPRLIGQARMADMMFTGRVYNAQDGERLGFAQYLVSAQESESKALEIALRIAENAPLTNYSLMHALPRISDQTSDHGQFTEALMSSIAQSAPEAKARVKAFLEGRAGKVKKAD